MRGDNTIATMSLEHRKMLYIWKQHTQTQNMQVLNRKATDRTVLSTDSTTVPCTSLNTRNCQEKKKNQCLKLELSLYSNSPHRLEIQITL